LRTRYTASARSSRYSSPPATADRAGGGATTTTPRPSSCCANPIGASSWSPRSGASSTGPDDPPHGIAQGMPAHELSFGMSSSFTSRLSTAMYSSCSRCDSPAHGFVRGVGCVVPMARAGRLARPFHRAHVAARFGRAGLGRAVRRNLDVAKTFHGRAGIPTNPSITRCWRPACPTPRNGAKRTGWPSRTASASRPGATRPDRCRCEHVAVDTACVGSGPFIRPGPGAA